MKHDQVQWFHPREFSPLNIDFPKKHNIKWTQKVLINSHYYCPTVSYDIY